MKRRSLALGAIVFLGTTATGCAPDPGTEQRSQSPEAATAVPSDDAPGTTTDAPAPATDTRAIRIDMADVPWAVPLAVDLDEMVRQQSGLYTQVLADGAGPRALPGDSMWVHYRVWLPNGRLLDGSLDRDPPEPIAMQLGMTPFIEGWTEGVTGMRVGERRRLIVPHELAYGPAGTPGVPPYSPLLYEVVLVSLRPGPASSDSR